MGLGSMVGGAAIDYAAKKAQLQAKLKSARSPEEQKAIKYFVEVGGCMKKPSVTDEDYDGLVLAKVNSLNLKKKALDKIGLDESQVNEIAPIHFENYHADKNDETKIGNDGVFRSTGYQVTWIFFSATQVYVYQYTFSMIGDSKKERTEEYFYKDITNFTTDSETVESMRFVTGGCMGSKVSMQRSTVDTNRFMLSAMGEKFYCAMQQNDYSEKVIQGMKAKLREKKNA